MYLPLVFTLFVTGYGSAEKSHLPKVTFFYESYCPYCGQYISKQLIPTFIEFYPKISIELVPFGNAKQRYLDGHWKFKCQHGRKECYGNKHHACAILEACGDKGSVNCRTDRLGKVLNYIWCVHGDNLTAASYQCATDVGLSPQHIKDCAYGYKGEHLLNIYGNRTLTFKPKIKYVPYVAINDVHSEEAERDLLQTVKSIFR